MFQTLTGEYHYMYQIYAWVTESPSRSGLFVQITINKSVFKLMSELSQL